MHPVRVSLSVISLNLKRCIRMDGIELLRNDHQRILVIINELITGGVGNVTQTGDTAKDINRQRRTLYDKLRELLVRHLSVEEKLLFPGLRGFVETRVLVDECCREHKRTADLLGRNKQLTESTEHWDGFLLQLERHIQSHVEREEDWLFPRARLLLGDAKLEQMLFGTEQVTSIQSATDIVAASADSLALGILA